MENKQASIQFNHLTLEVKSLEASIKFYTETLHLKEKNRPNFDFPGVWYDLGKGIELHLIENIDASLKLDSNSRAFHFAMEVDDINVWRAYFISTGINIAKDIKTRPDGALQMYITDPDGYYVELTQLPE